MVRRGRGTRRRRSSGRCRAAPRRCRRISADRGCRWKPSGYALPWAHHNTRRMQRPSRIIGRDRIRQVAVRPHQTGPRGSADDSATGSLCRPAPRRQGALRSGARQQQESWEAGMSKRVKGLTRRQFAKAAGATAALAAVPMTHIRKIYAATTTELTHWSWLSASDGEIWQKMIDSFNDAHKDKGVQIKMEV